jgi:hypothetical protein
MVLFTCTCIYVSLAIYIGLQLHYIRRLYDSLPRHLRVVVCKNLLFFSGFLNTISVISRRLAEVLAVNDTSESEKNYSRLQILTV